MTTAYADFLKHKTPIVGAVGVQPTPTHPILHDWQTDIVEWAVRKGRAAIFADCGLGKSFMQIEWARMVADTTIILAPLSVAKQTVREAAKLDQTIHYVRDQSEVTGPGTWITNYEMADKFDASQFGAVVLDESSILKNHTGSTRNALIKQWGPTPYKLACTATPAPNDVTELTNHAEFLGILPRTEMLAAYFVHDQDGWRIKGHAQGPMFEWMAQWAVAIRKPSDIGHDDTGYDLPPLRIESHFADVSELAPEGQLFPTELGGVTGRSRVRRHTSDARVALTVEMANGPGQWIIWCGLNDEAAALAKAITGAVNVHGSMDPEQKADYLEQFQAGDLRVLVTKTRIAGFGMNFQNCHQMIFCGIGDSYEAYYQAIRRCYRFGQTKPVDAHIVVSELENQIVENVKRKETETNTMTHQLVKAIRKNNTL